MVAAGESALLCGLLRCQSPRRLHEVLVKAAETNKYIAVQQNKNRKKCHKVSLKRGAFSPPVHSGVKPESHKVVAVITRSDNQPIKFYIMTIHANLE
ncbi:hypothetical protein scyTo_0003924 [Scyliorhinus torazame]|uniref:Uncharacterized protein n=1 Tax=Scyliorhinus torazame TaxID=75743 RepID=A0A401NHM1_SCYTO|nr:hypothetical protein [Scyliorhinus torazame]